MEWGVENSFGQMIQSYSHEHQESARLNVLGGWG